MEAMKKKRDEMAIPQAMSKAMLWFVFALLLVLSLRASANNYIDLPLLVNVCADSNHAEHEGIYESRKQYIDRIKETVELTCKDVNLRILKGAADRLGKDVRLRLGPVTVQDMVADPNFPNEVSQGSVELRRLYAAGTTELAKKLNNKGIKVNIVNVVRRRTGEPILGLGQIGPSEKIKNRQGEEKTVRHGRAVTIDDDEIMKVVYKEGLYPTPGEHFSRNGHILLHEIGHNSGMVPDHNQNNPLETGFMTSPPSRSVSDEQWQMLEELFKRFGNKVTNKDQRTSFVPPTRKTHYCIIPEPYWITVPPVESLTLTIHDTDWLMGQIAFVDLLPMNSAFNYEFSIAINTDNNINTCGWFEEYGQGFEFLATLYLQNNPAVGTSPSNVHNSGDVSGATSDTLTVSGTLTYLNGYQHVTVPLEATHYSEAGSVGSDANYVSLTSVVTFSHDISAFPISSDNIPVKAKLVKNGSSAGFVTTNIESSSNPSLPSLPVTMESFALITITGQGFASNSGLSLYLAHVNSFATAPAVTGITDSAGDFRLFLNVEGPALGDYIVTAIDDNGNIATGVITVGDVHSEDILIDDFNTDLAPFTVTGQDGTFPVRNGTTVEDSMLGGEFDIVISLHEVSLPSDGATVEIVDGHFCLRQDATSISQAILVWDGPDHSPFEVNASNGLGGGVDMMSKDAVVLDILRNDVPLDAAIVLFSSVDDSSELSLNIPAVTEPIAVAYPFTDFSVNGNGVDPTSVTTVLVFIGPGRGVTGPAHLEIDAIRIVPAE